MSQSSDHEKSAPEYEPPKLVEHGKLAEVTQSTPELPDALDSTLGAGERGPEGSLDDSAD